MNKKSATITAMLCFTVFSLCVHFFSGLCVLAKSTTVLKTVNDDCQFFFDSSLSSSAFCIKKGYYLTLYEEGESYYKVRYAETVNGYVSVFGYVKKEDVVKTDEAFCPMFPETESTTTSGCVLYSDAEMKNAVCGIMPEKTLKVYGVSPDELSAFVIVEGNLGFLPLSALSPFEIEEHPKEREEKPTETAPPVSSVPYEMPREIKIMLVVSVCVPVVVLSFLTFDTEAKVGKRN